MSITDRDVRLIRRLVAATAVLYVLLIGGAIWVYAVSDSNRTALCALRLDLEGRVATSEQLLIEHPRGIAGVTRDSIKNQKRTITALSDLDCQ